MHIPRSRYWTPDTVDAVGRRYANMDMTPYWEGLGGSDAALVSPGLAQQSKL